MKSWKLGWRDISALALHRLGLRVRLLGKVGDNPLGPVMMELLRRQEFGLDRGMIVACAQAGRVTISWSPWGLAWAG